MWRKSTSLVIFIFLGIPFQTLTYGGRQFIRDMHEMVRKNIVPDIIDQVPRSKLGVRYGKLRVEFGNELTPFQVRDEPEIIWEANPKKLYLLCMIDPDVPSRQEPYRGEAQHFLVGNIPGSNVSKGEILTQYFGSGPPKDTGKHRYIIFLVYEQPKRLTFDEKFISYRFDPARFNFSIRKFARKYRLGQPIAGNFFVAEWDFSVVSPPQQ